MHTFIPLTLTPILTLLSIVALVHCIPLTLPSSSPIALNASSSSLALNASSLDRCDFSKRRSWSAPTFLVEDCFAAVNQFYISRVLGNPDEVFEFAPGSARASTRHRWVQTPAVWEYDSCTLAIVELNRFSPGQLPGDSSFHLQPYDLSSYTGLWRAAKVVEMGCLQPPRRVPGWAPAGAHGGIGVFLWATESDINRLIDEQPGFGAMNGSAAGLDDSIAR